MDKRKDGVIYEKVRCPNGRVIVVPVLFSFKVKEEEDGKLVGFDFSPPGIVNLLKEKKHFTVKQIEGDRIKLTKSRVVSCRDDRCVVELSQESTLEKRFYVRFSFCPEELGEFTLKFPTGEEEKVRILDMSMSGVKLCAERPKRSEVSTKEPLLLVQGTKILTVRPVRWEKDKGKLIIGARIVRANFNLVGFIINRYIERVLKLLNG